MIRRLLFVCIFAGFSVWGDHNPIATYITWQNDPTSTITLQWLTREGEETHDLFYKKEGEKKWNIALSTQITFPDRFPYVLHRVEIYQLEPGARYIFKPGSWEADTRKFRTLSKDPNQILRFAVGGDMYHDEIKYLISTHRHVSKKYPHFAIAGGDIAYAGTKSINKGTPHNERWITFLKSWSDEMVTPDGVTIPIVPAIGNHDVNGRYGQPPEQAVFFYTFFPFKEEKGFHSLDIGQHISLFILDSGHTNSIDGKQSEWLQKTLKERKNVPHKFAAYHVPAYPSVRKYKDKISTKIRQHWVPLFEKYNLTSAFEHHDHAYKRTHPLINGRISKNGVTYLGDGAYGVRRARKPKTPHRTWYLAQSAQVRHFMLVTINGAKRKIQAINDQGVVFDQLDSTVQILDTSPPLAH